jgi:glutamine amidotransferase
MFYFVHSYHVVCNDPTDALSTTNYGYDFVSSLSSDNIIGVQFHPEKSHKYGMKVLENFSMMS